MSAHTDIIRAWCASCGMPEPSNGDCMALVAALGAEPSDWLAAGASQAVGHQGVATTAESLHPSISHRGHFNQEGWPCDWHFNGGPREGEPWILGCMDNGRVFVGGVYHKELSGERCEQMVVGLAKKLQDARAEVLDARVALKSVLAAKEAP